MLLSFSDIGKRNPPNFSDAACVTSEILQSGVEFKSGEIWYNHFKNVISYDQTKRNIFTFDGMSGDEKLDLFDDLDSETLKSYLEFSLATNLYYCLVQGKASEESARMNAMEN